MVGPISEEERASFNRRVTIGVTVLVGASAGLVAVQAGATPVESVGVTAVGFVVGSLVARFVVPSGPAPATRQRRRRASERESPFADGGQNGGGGQNGDGGRDDSTNGRADADRPTRNSRRG